ncbi:MAG: trypsin-like peptidase domain-containing protein [Candidatus Paceibacterota bacterium]
MKKRNLSDKRLVELMRLISVTISNESFTEWHGGGIGILKGNRSFVWTCSHCLPRKRKKFFIKKNIICGERIVDGVSSPVRIIKHHPLLDIALLEVESGNFLDKTTTFYIGSDIPILTPAFCCGAPADPDYAGTVITGNISNYVNFPAESENPHIFFNGMVCGGLSGSGLYLRNGMCIGMLQSHILRTKNGIACCMSMRGVYDWAKSAGLGYALPRCSTTF